MLVTQMSSLRAEVFQLKSAILQHGGCDCMLMREYIAGAAEQIVQPGAQVCHFPSVQS